MAKKIKLLDFERKRPLKLTPEGKFITFEKILSKDVKEEFDIVKLSHELPDLRYSEKKKLVLERYRMVPEDYDKVIHVIGRGSFTVQQNIKEIENDTDFGKELVEIEMRFLSRIIKKYISGEIEK